MQVLCLCGQRKSKPRLKSELRKQYWICCDTFWLQSFGTRNSSLANAKYFVLLYVVLFWIWGQFPTPSLGGLYLDGRFIGGFFALRVWGGGRGVIFGRGMEGLIFGILRQFSFSKPRVPLTFSKYFFFQSSCRKVQLNVFSLGIRDFYWARSGPWQDSEPCLPEEGGWRGVLPSSRLMGMCRWMGSYLHAWRQKIQVCRDLKIERFTLH